METVKGGGSPVVARFLDGRVLKGTTHDFAPAKPVFHLSVWGEDSPRALPVPIGALKALFFVKTFTGDKNHVEDLDVDNAKGQGRKIVVTFADGEVVAGITTGYSPDKPGFFVIPVDPESNNSRIFVVTASVKNVAWAGTPLSVAGAGATKR
jgi:Family of unknown function (DUF6982)